MKRAAAILTAAILGCSTTEALNPVPGTTSDAGATGGGGQGGSGGAPVDAGPPKRTVLQRNPFGNVAETQNLLWDGDFEFYSPFSDEYGWLAGTNANTISYTFTDVKMGAVCKSGLRCGWLKKKHVMVGLGVASKGNKLSVGVWAHVASGTCDKVSVTLSDFDLGVDPDVDIKPKATDPDAEGWCRFEAVVDPRQGKPALFVQNESDGDVLVDDAVITKVDSMMAIKAFHGPPSAALAADLEGARASFQRLRGPHDAPPNAARRAYERWRNR